LVVRLVADDLRAVDFAGRFAIFILAAGLRFVVLVAMLAPVSTQANHLQHRENHGRLGRSRVGSARMVDVEAIRRIHEARLTIAKASQIDYADGIQCMVDCTELLQEIARLNNEVADLNGLIAAYRKWARECPILEMPGVITLGNTEQAC
jgi:hypothetical protein